MKIILLCLLYIAPVLLVASAGGAVHPLGDSLAVFRFPIGVASFVSAVGIYLLGLKRVAEGIALLSIAASGAIWWSYRPAPTDGDFGDTLYQKNMLVILDNPKPLIADIQEKAPDFITLQEMTPRTQSVLAALGDMYPTQSSCISQRGRGVALASRFPPVLGSRICHPEDGILAEQVMTPDGPVWLVSIHLRWPYPIDQATQVGLIVPVLENLTGPVILAGDFNMVPWSYSMTRIEEATRTQRIGRTNGTFLLEHRMMLPIDHVLAPKACGGDVSTLDLLGSDHHGVLASLSLKRCH
nr:endonuclease/exonuclease/phosphatase family protein [Amylibacter sp.]